MLIVTDFLGVEKPHFWVYAPVDIKRCGRVVNPPCYNVLQALIFSVYGNVFPVIRSGMLVLSITLGKFVRVTPYTNTPTRAVVCSLVDQVTDGTLPAPLFLVTFSPPVSWSARTMTNVPGCASA